MDYSNLYDLFIASRRKIEKITIEAGYYEIHHVLPRSMGGSNAQENLIALSVRDHIFAHSLLAKAYGGKTWYAYWMMINGTASARAKKAGELVRISSRSASIARRNLVKHMRETRGGERHHYFGVPRSEEVKEKISQSLKQKYENGFIAPTKGWKRSKETREKSSVAMKKFYANGGIPPRLGKKHTEEARKKISAAQTGALNNNYGKPLKKEHARKIGEAQIGLKNHYADHSIYKFIHDSGDIFIGYRTDFLKKYGLCKGNIGRLVKGQQKKHKGWSLGDD